MTSLGELTGLSAFTDLTSLAFSDDLGTSADLDVVSVAGGVSDLSVLMGASVDAEPSVSAAFAGLAGTPDLAGLSGVSLTGQRSLAGL